MGKSFILNLGMIEMFYTYEIFNETLDQLYSLLKAKIVRQIKSILAPSVKMIKMTENQFVRDEKGQLVKYLHQTEGFQYFVCSDEDYKNPVLKLLRAMGNCIQSL